MLTYQQVVAPRAGQLRVMGRGLHRSRHDGVRDSVGDAVLALEARLAVAWNRVRLAHPPWLVLRALLFSPPPLCGNGECHQFLAPVPEVLGPPEGAVRAMAMTSDFTGGFLCHPARLQLIPCHPCRAAPAVLLLWVAKNSSGGRVRVSESAVCCCGCAEWSPAMSTSGGDVELRVQAGRR